MLRSYIRIEEHLHGTWGRRDANTSRAGLFVACITKCTKIAPNQFQTSNDMHVNLWKIPAKYQHHDPNHFKALEIDTDIHVHELVAASCGLKKTLFRVFAKKKNY